MSTLAKKLLYPSGLLESDSWGLLFDFADIDSCTAKGYGTTGCMMSMDTSKLGLANANTNMVMGMGQCFSTSLSVPFPAMGMGLMGNAVLLRGRSNRARKTRTATPAKNV